MKKLFIVSCCMALLAACSKHDRHDPPATPPAGAPLLDSMVWARIGATTYFTYRPDSLQDRVTTVDPYVRDTARFEYHDRQLSRIVNLRRHRFSDYFYNASGRISAIVISGYSAPEGDFRFEFEYNATGTVHTLSLYIQKGTDKQWVSTYTYEYNNEGLISRIKGTTSFGTATEFNISGYTEECNFNPWVFVQPVDLTESLPVYNLPVLQTLKRLPLKVKVTYTGNEYDEETTATIVNHNLTRLVRSTVFVDDPVNVFTDDIMLYWSH